MTLVRIQEIGKVFKGDETFVIATAVTTHNRIVVKEEHWRIPWDMPTHEAASLIADEVGAESWQYQTMWTHPILEKKPRPLRFVNPT